MKMFVKELSNIDLIEGCSVCWTYGLFLHPLRFHLPCLKSTVSGKKLTIYSARKFWQNFHPTHRRSWKRNTDQISISSFKSGKNYKNLFILSCFPLFN